MNRNTETALLRMTNYMLMSADSGKTTVLILLDLGAAFDMVDHTIRLNTLETLDWSTWYCS